MSAETYRTPEITAINLGRRIVNFVGPEGSGKSTIAKMLAEDSGKPLFSVGDMLRHYAATDSGIFGKTTREMFEKHLYFMDRRMLLNMFAETFRNDQFSEGFILEGAMRELTEVQGFTHTLRRAGRDMPVSIVLLRIPGWMGVERLSSNPTKRGRADDNAEAVVERMSHYFDGLAGRATVMEHHRGWTYHHVDGKGDIQSVYRNVVQVLTSQRD